MSDTAPMSLDADAPRDARALLGMHTTGARLVVGAYLTLASFAILYLIPGTPDQIAAAVSVLAILSCATVAILAVPGDPLPMRAAIPMGAAGAGAAAVALATFDSSTSAAPFNWIHALGTAVLCFMCVRGRTAQAWCGMAAMIGVYAVFDAIGPVRVGVGPLITLIDVAPLSMATVFSLTLRPSAKQIFDLREAGARRAAELAARAAVAAERDAQLAELDVLARPMLDRIAAGADLSDSERQSCELLEAHLRDRLRAPGLTTTEVADAARAARSRGVEVILIDDRQTGPTTASALRRVHAAVVQTLSGVDSGDVRVRLLPPNRAAIASVVVRDGGVVYRREFDSDGTEVRDDRMHTGAEQTTTDGVHD